MGPRIYSPSTKDSRYKPHCYPFQSVDPLPVAFDDFDLLKNDIPSPVPRTTAKYPPMTPQSAASKTTEALPSSLNCLS